jgi:polyamine oxidase
VTDELSYTVVAQPENQTMTEVLEVLGNRYPDIPAPNGFLFPRWTSDPLFRGSYSDWPAGYPRILHEQMSAPIGPIHFAVEAKSCPYFGLMQGAYFEGISAANDILQCINGNRDTAVGTFDILLGCEGIVHCSRDLQLYL